MFKNASQYSQFGERQNRVAPHLALFGVWEYTTVLGVPSLSSARFVSQLARLKRLPLRLVAVARAVVNLCVGTTITLASFCVIASTPPRSYIQCIGYRVRFKNSTLEAG